MTILWQCSLIEFFFFLRHPQICFSIGFGWLGCGILFKLTVSIFIDGGKPFKSWKYIFFIFSRKKLDELNWICCSVDLKYSQFRPRHCLPLNWTLYCIAFYHIRKGLFDKKMRMSCVLFPEKWARLSAHGKSVQTWVKCSTLRFGFKSANRAFWSSRLAHSRQARSIEHTKVFESKTMAYLT